MPADATSSTAARRQRLVQRRKALGLTQEALAELVAVGRSMVVRWERGESEPLPSIRPRLARALKVSADLLESLLTDDDQRGDGTAPRQLPAAVADFTGRAAELQRLTQVLDAAGAGRPGTVVISAIGGMAGVGKTALALHWAHQFVTVLCAVITAGVLLFTPNNLVHVPNPIEPTPSSRPSPSRPSPSPSPRTPTRPPVPSSAPSDQLSDLLSGLL